MTEFFTEFLKSYGGPSAVLLLAVVIIAVWLFAHWNTSPGKEVSIFFGLATYTKKTTGTEPLGELRSFCDQVAGHWWSFQDGNTASLGFVTMVPYKPTRTVQVIGDAYNKKGVHVAHWKSQASCINLTERKVYYYWEGYHSSKAQSQPKTTRASVRSLLPVLIPARAYSQTRTSAT